jgi:hypothetical protein
MLNPFKHLAGTFSDRETVHCVQCPYPDNFCLFGCGSEIGIIIYLIGYRGFGAPAPDSDPERIVLKRKFKTYSSFMLNNKIVRDYVHNPKL